MKKLGKGLLVLAATIMSFISVQNACAVTVTGTITATSTQPNTITVDATTVVYGVQFDYVLNECGITLAVDLPVEIEAVEFYCNHLDANLLQAIIINDCVLQEMELPRQKGRR